MLSWFGIIALMMSLIPVVAISPILLYIGMLIGAQAFQETPKSHAPAVVLALVPHVAAWGKLQIDSSLGAAGTSAAAVGLDKLAQVGVLYHGLEVLGGGAILVEPDAGRDRRVRDRSRVRARPRASPLAGAVLTFFGFMHGEAIGFGKSPMVALSYLVVAGGAVRAVALGGASRRRAPATEHRPRHAGRLGAGLNGDGPRAQPAARSRAVCSGCEAVP